MGLDNPLIADLGVLGTPQSLPPEPFHSIGVHLANRSERFRLRHEA